LVHAVNEQLLLVLTTNSYSCTTPHVVFKVPAVFSSSVQVSDDQEDGSASTRNNASRWKPELLLNMLFLSALDQLMMCSDETLQRPLWQHSWLMDRFVVEELPI
jgi:hypothetical protein